jgi:hypothetical protein
MRNAMTTEKEITNGSEAVLRSLQPKKSDPMDAIISEICGDRRNRRRYNINLRLQYKLFIQGHVAQTGAGKTVNLSGGGVACELDETLQPDSSIELAIAWPVLLNRTCPLKLVVTGKVVRSNAALTAIRIERYEFRTQGSQPLRVVTAGSLA